MPAVLTVNQCDRTRHTYTFDSEVLDYAIEGTYDWITLTLVGIDPGPPSVASYSVVVYENAPIGVTTIELSPGLDYFTITITEDCTVSFEVCQFSTGTTGPIDPPVSGDAWDSFITDGSGTITWSLDNQTLTYEFLEEGTFWITLQSNGDPDEQIVYSYTVTNCYIDACADPDSNYLLRIVWLNPTGGWSSYLFNQKKTYGVEIGGSRVFKNSDRETLYIQHDNIFNSVVQPSGLIPESHVDFLKSLKYSIAAYVYDGASGDDITYLPIFNYARSFELKKQANGFYKYDFEFSYSAEIITQTR